MISFLKKQISLNGGIALFILGFLLSLALTRFCMAGENQPTAGKAIERQVSGNDCEITSYRRTGFDFISPLLYVEKSCKSTDYITVENSVKKMIATFKASNDISHVAVYLRDFEHSRWTGVDERDGFSPGSLSKVPLLMTCLSKAGTDPSILDKEYLFEAPPKGTLPAQNYKGESIEPGKKYTVQALLRYMIEYSDNNATWLLTEKIGIKNYEKTYLDLGVVIPRPDPIDNIMRISARDISVFFRAMYNASYLSPEHSEYALALLGKTSFGDGFAKGLPEGTKVAHKFAEWDNGVDFELHETGIFYVKGKAYLLTIMTRGKNREPLANVIASLTQLIYTQVSEP